MGLKRKASEFDDTPMSFEARTSPIPSLSSSPLSAASSNASHGFNHQPYNFWNIGAIPYLNSRTRKRFRDGRPSEEVIHEDTLKKLYDGQRRLKAEAVEEYHIDNPLDMGSPNAMEDVDIDMARRTINNPIPQATAPIEKNQRRIESFFGGRRSAKANIYEPSANTVHPAPRFGCTVNTQPPAVLTCEDCSAPLVGNSTGEAVDADMLDADVLALPAEVEREWPCSRCSRVVCDTCAVRGDVRVCLECAAAASSGANVYARPDEIQARRWVGGVGWM